METSSREHYIPVRKSQINYYRNVPLYCKSSVNGYVLYKPAGIIVSDLRIDENRHPQLYICQKHRLAGIKEVQKAFNKKIAQSIRSGDLFDVKLTLCNLVEETLAEPRSGTLRALPEAVDMLVTGYSRQPDIVKTFASISFKDYTTVLHSINVMALTIDFCFHTQLTLQETKKLGLTALLHDVGKTQVPTQILRAPRRLTDAEFEVMKRHPSIGRSIIIEKSGIDAQTARGVVEHHEKLDGSGYPRGIRQISFAGQLLGIIDCYEALTNEDRPYRRAMKPLESLTLIKDDVEAGKFSRDIFEKFCYSLV
jgi:HD-GYP domain-containing protein (c-di-GMP phosphodiesterase class II)